MKTNADQSKRQSTSQWYAGRTEHHALLFGMTNAMPEWLSSEIDRLMKAVARIGRA